MHVRMCVHLLDVAEDDVQTDRLCIESVSASVQDTDIVLLPGTCKSWEHAMKCSHCDPLFVCA